MLARLLLSLTLVPALAPAQTTIAPWQPTPGHKQIPIWPGHIPDARPITGPEVTKLDTKNLIGGKSLTYINTVSIPTLTVYKPTAAKNTGAAVIVFPGGGYQIIAIDLEGTEVCDWLTAKGITCILSKYRVPGEDVLPKSGGYPKSPEALEDAQRTISLVRAHAAGYGIDPHKIGVLGFSAGGHLVAATSVHFARRIYKPVDTFDTVSCRPDFAIALYPGHLYTTENSINLNPDIATHITRNTPPTFLLQNENDRVDRVEDSISYFFGLKKAGVPTEMHVYAEGGHAFGLRPTKYPATHWPALVETWLHTIGMLP
jgi:acetyl esterase/lipase